MIAGCLAKDAQTSEWIRIYLPDEEADSERFLRDCANYVGVNIKTLTAGKSVNDVIRQKRFLNSPYGGPCTGPLKTQVRLKWEAENINNGDNVTYVWGFDVKEKHRAERMIINYPNFKHEFPLIDNCLTKNDCHGILKALGLKRPRMYELGFPNNNCIMCVKAGMGSLNNFRKYFPAQYDERAKLEREIGHSCLKKYFLDELPEDAGRTLKPISEELTLSGIHAFYQILKNLGKGSIEKSYELSLDNSFVI